MEPGEGAGESRSANSFMEYLPSALCVYTGRVADLAFPPCKCDVINGEAADVRRRGKGLQQQKKMENEPQPVPRR